MDENPRIRWKVIQPSHRSTSTSRPDRPPPQKSHDRSNRQRKWRPDRASNACETCRAKKVKCDEVRSGCSYCQRHDYHCQYRSAGQVQQHPSPSLTQRVDEIKSKLGSLSDAIDAAGIREPISETVPSDIKEIDDRTNSPSSPFYGSVITTTSTTSSLKSILHDTVTGSLERQDCNNLYLNTANHTPDSHSHYGTALASEEHRNPLPDSLALFRTPHGSEISTFIYEFLDRFNSLYPMMCDRVAVQLGSTLSGEGFGDNMASCVAFLCIAVAKAFGPGASIFDGLPEFQKAVLILSRLNVQLSLEYAQAQALCAMFLHRKGMLLGFWSYLSAGCNTLAAMIRRDQVDMPPRTSDEKNTILRLYWILFNLERDVAVEIDIFTKSGLGLLEHEMRLPTNCSEPETPNMSDQMRVNYLFFLAEMSIKSILARILTTRASDLLPLDTICHRRSLSLIFQELDHQLSEWLGNVPILLRWSPEVGRGIISKTGTRLKLLYWYARFSLFKPLCEQSIQKAHAPLHVDEDKCIQEYVTAGRMLLEVFVCEESVPDMILAQRTLSVILSLQKLYDSKQLDGVERSLPSSLLQRSCYLLASKVGNISVWFQWNLLHSL